MSNTIQIKNGSSKPSSSILASYELGYVKGGSLYINNGGTIVELANPKVSALIDSSSGYLKLPSVAATTSNTGRILVANSSNIVYYKTANNLTKELFASGDTILSSYQYGNSLPSTAPAGKIFFKKVSE